MAVQSRQGHDLNCGTLPTADVAEVRVSSKFFLTKASNEASKLLISVCLFVLWKNEAEKCCCHCCYQSNLTMMMRSAVLMLLLTSAAAFVAPHTHTAASTSSLPMVATWFRQNLEREYTEKQVLLSTPEPQLDTAELVEALQESVVSATTTASDKTASDKAALALLAYKLKLDVAEQERRANQKTEKAARSLLAYRLESQSAAAMESLESSEGVTNSLMSQPLSEAEEQKRAAKYAAIDDIEERAFTILKDLGMIQPSLDFSI